MPDDGPISRGVVLAQFERVENTYSAVHRAMQFFYGGHCTLESALMRKAALFNPPHILIIKPPDPQT